MGIYSEDCKSASKLIGYKVFLNNIMTFQKLGQSIKFRDAIIANGTFELFRNGSLPVPQDIEVLWGVSI